MTAAPRAVLISHKHPFPMDDGKKAVLTGFVAYLVERFGAANVTYVVVGRAPDPGPSVELPCETIWVRGPGRLAQAGHAAASLLGLGGRSLQEAVTHSARVGRELRRLCAERAPVLLVMDTLRIGQFFESPRSTGARRVLYMDDLFHLRFERLAALAAGEGPQSEIADHSPVGTFGPMLPRLAHVLLSWAPLRNALYRLEARKIARTEFEAPARFDACLLINPSEVELLRRQGRGGSPQVVKPVLFAGAGMPQRRFNGEPVFILFGSLRHPVHRASVVKVLGPAGDALFSRVAGLRLLVIGDGLDDELRALCSRRPAVQACGFVDDIGPLFATACALLVPSIAGGGLRIKALSAMFHGLPIVSTGTGVEGIPLVAGESYLRADQVEAFAELMLRLLDPAFNAQVSRAASAVFREHYGPEAVFREYDALFGLTPAPSSALRPVRDG